MTLVLVALGGIVVGGVGTVALLAWGLYRIGKWFRETERAPAVQIPPDLGSATTDAPAVRGQFLSNYDSGDWRH